MPHLHEYPECQCVCVRMHARKYVCMYVYMPECMYACIVSGKLRKVCKYCQQYATSNKDSQTSDRSSGVLKAGMSKVILGIDLG